jgi:hypothetical protein
LATLQRIVIRVAYTVIYFNLTVPCRYMGMSFGTTTIMHTSPPRDPFPFFAANDEMFIGRTLDFLIFTGLSWLSPRGFAPEGKSLGWNSRDAWSGCFDLPSLATRLVRSALNMTRGEGLKVSPAFRPELTHFAPTTLERRAPVRHAREKWFGLRRITSVAKAGLRERLDRRHKCLLHPAVPNICE